MGRKRKHRDQQNGNNLKKIKPKVTQQANTMTFDPTKDYNSDDFFELAQADVIQYKNSRKNSDAMITIAQNRDIEPDHRGHQTGGIVWETAFLLSMYLVDVYDKKNPQRPAQPVHSIVEVGAGCGLLGLVLAQEWGARVTLTDTPTATATLLRNTAANKAVLRPPAVAEAKVLRWDEVGDREALDLESKPELIIGTDVVFTTWLVEPLLATMHALAKPETVIYLCLQTRCAVSLLLFSLASQSSLLTSPLALSPPGFSCTVTGKGTELLSPHGSNERPPRHGEGGGGR